MRGHLAEESSRMMRRHHAQNDFSIAQRSREIISDFNGCRNCAIRKEEIVLAVICYGATDLIFVCPQADLMAITSSQHDGERGAPCAGSNDCNAAHRLPLM